MGQGIEFCQIYDNILNKRKLKFMVQKTTYCYITDVVGFLNGIINGIPGEFIILGIVNQKFQSMIYLVIRKNLSKKIYYKN